MLLIDTVPMTCPEILPKLIDKNLSRIQTNGLRTTLFILSLTQYKELVFPSCGNQLINLWSKSVNLRLHDKNIGCFGLTLRIGSAKSNI